MSSPPLEDRRLPAAYVQAWRADAPTELEAQRDYLRFLQKRPRLARPRALQILAWMGAGMLLGMGSLFAATAAPWQLLSFSWNKTAERSQPTVTRAPARSAPRLPPERVDEPTPAEAAAPPQVAADPPASEHPAARESWRRAAQGLKTRDFESTNDALLKLSQQGTEAEREAARMVRAQLLLSQGQIAEAQQLLEGLRGASSPSIRSKARALLEETRQSAASHRSFELGASTKDQ